MATKRRRRKKCKYGTTKRRVRTKSGKRRRCKRKKRKKRFFSRKKSVEDYGITRRRPVFVDTSIIKGDILVFENFGGPKFLKIQHTEIAMNNSIPIEFDTGESGIQLSTASCGQGKKGSACQEVNDRNFPIKVGKSRQKIHVIRYVGTDSEYMRMLAGNIADNWTFEAQIRYPTIFESITSAFPRAGIMPCYRSIGDRRSGQKYIDGAINESVPFKRGGEKVKMFCSKFVMGVWFAALGRRFGWEGIDKCIPIKPSNCSPADVLKLPMKSSCWEKVKTLNIDY